MQKVHVGKSRASADNVIQLISGAEDMYAKVKHLGEVLSSTKAVGLTRIYLICDERITRWQGSWGRHGAHLGPTGPRRAPCWPHELCYLDLCIKVFSSPGPYNFWNRYRFLLIYYLKGWMMKKQVIDACKQISMLYTTNFKYHTLDTFTHSRHWRRRVLLSCHASVQLSIYSAGRISKDVASLTL